MIPKTIHYCWFGGKALPKLARKCMRSWHKYCPDYEIVCWNESNYDISSAPLFVQQAYQAKKWAFVTDYARLQIIYENGGIYLDTDVELIRSLDSLLDNKAYFGFESESTINTGLGFGAEKETPFLKELMEEYNYIPFFLDEGKQNVETCTVRNSKVFIHNGLLPNGEEQVLKNGIRVLPIDRFRPYHDWQGTLNLTSESFSIHWYNASWQSARYKKEKKESVRKLKEKRKKEWIRYLPNRILRKLLGPSNYEKLKLFIKNK